VNMAFPPRVVAAQAAGTWPSYPGGVSCGVISGCESSMRQQWAQTIMGPK
jgi:hypothetical protein